MKGSIPYPPAPCGILLCENAALDKSVQRAAPATLTTLEGIAPNNNHPPEVELGCVSSALAAGTGAIVRPEVDDILTKVMIAWLVFLPGASATSPSVGARLFQLLLYDL